jgi:hypothetical protein
MPVTAKMVSKGTFGGKTYTLFGSNASTEEYYGKIAVLADRVLEHEPDIETVIVTLQRLSRKKRFLKRGGRIKDSRLSLLRLVLQASQDVLSPHTAAVKAHLAELSLLKRWDATLFTSEEQYHLYMLLIELANRAWGQAFRTAKRKVAFLPYCLRDLSAACRSEPGELDYVCKGCTQDCYVNRVSVLLRSTGIEPYIWMNASLKRLLKELLDGEGNIGVLGVACVPELFHGLRMCMSLKIPVVGIPLNANRCMRWMGTFHPTSVDLEALRRLLSGTSAD